MTLGLLHGCVPHGMILVYEAGRQNVLGMDYVPLTPLTKIVEVNEMMASLAMPSQVIGVAMNSRLLNAGRSGSGTRARAARVGRAGVRRDSPRAGTTWSTRSSRCSKSCFPIWRRRRVK